jgi:predicted SprT family Zn-dependent metalloprotease
MPKKQVPLNTLETYLPENCSEEVIYFLNKYKVQLTVTRQRQSILGDFRHAHLGKTHRISVNGNLNKYSFLITLLHELAHLFTFEQYGNKVQPHGKEWKNHFSTILANFISKKIFPNDIENALYKTISNPAASSCGDENLLRVLLKYDKPKESHLLVEQVEFGCHFEIKGGRIFRKDELVRKRFKCTELSTGKQYLFSGLYEVVKLKTESL